jgi:ribosomal protein S12 methylthiotransferase accessory factor
MHVAINNLTLGRPLTLVNRMVSPLCGLTRSVGFILRSTADPQFITAGGHLTGVHVMRGVPDPGPFYYHIGGGGLVLEEAIIRCLGESIERCAQFMADVVGQHRVLVASYEELTGRGERVVSARALDFFTSDQLARPQCPFRPFDRRARFGWIKARSLVSGSDVWIPAQLLLVGYRGRPGESKLLSSVTTGTAAHTQLASALRNAVCEVIQIDSAMGHWYSARVASQLTLDQRTRPVQSILDRYCAGHPSIPQFYLLENADLPGFTIACLVRRPNETPTLGVGLGSAFRLNHAMYSALLEAVGVFQMAKKVLLDRLDPSTPDQWKECPDDIADLDTNVAYYAVPGHSELIDAKFSADRTVATAALPGDIELDAAGELKILLDSFRTTGKELFGLNLTTNDYRDLGFAVARVWSPDTISLPLPGFPPLLHRRFEAYGGVGNVQPHPYP